MRFRAVIEVDLEVGDQVALGEGTEVTRGFRRLVERGDSSQQSARLVVEDIERFEGHLNLVALVVADQNRPWGHDRLSGTIAATGTHLGRPDARQAPPYKQSQNQQHDIGDAKTRKRHGPATPFATTGIAVTDPSGSRGW